MRTRIREHELMDDPDLDPQQHKLALDGLAMLNEVSGASAHLSRLIASLTTGLLKGQPFRVLDLACGDGHNVIDMAVSARMNGLPISFTGCDISDTAVSFARERASKACVDCDFFQLDVIRDELPDSYDLIMTTLFTHHLDEDQVVTLLRKMNEAAVSYGVVNDLVRSPFNYGLVWLATRIFSRSPVVHFDGPVSVRAAFTKAELQGLANGAGIQKATVKESFPCRMTLLWKK